MILIYLDDKKSNVKHLIGLFERNKIFKYKMHILYV